MPIPSTVSDLSTTASSNYPSGSESANQLDDYHRALCSIVRQVSDAKEDAGVAATAITAERTAVATLTNKTLISPTLGTPVSGNLANCTGYPYSSLSGTPASLPSGAVSAFAMNSAPTGWLKANGSAVSRTTYADLFTAIGTTFGVGDGSTTFNIPDLRGEFIRGWDDSRGIDSGRVFGSAQADELKSHVHSVSAQLGTAGGAPQSSGSSSLNPYNTNATGGTETRPRNIALLYCIKT